MPKVRTFVSFDYDHDLDLKTLLIGQTRNPQSPFEVSDWSVQDALTGDWQRQVRSKIGRVQRVIVICGAHTHQARGVSTELRMAKEAGVPYFLLWGRKDLACTKPVAAAATDKIYKWTWDNLKKLIAGDR